MRRFVLLQALLLLLVSGVHRGLGQTSRDKKRLSNGSKSGSDLSAPAAAIEGLKILKTAITAENFKQFGFDSLDQVARATVGKGIPLYYVRADQLQEYTSGTDAGKLMMPTNRRLFPILADKSAKLVMTLEYSDEHWKLVSFGQQDIASPLNSAQVNTNPRSSAPGSYTRSYFVVQIPALRLSFLAFSPPAGPGGPPTTKRQVTFMALDSINSMTESFGAQGSQFLANNPQFNSVSKGAKSANQVFAALAPQATTVLQTNAPR